MKFVVNDTIKVAGELRKPGAILGEELNLPETLTKDLLAAGLIGHIIFGKDGQQAGDQGLLPDDTASPTQPGSVQHDTLLPHGDAPLKPPAPTEPKASSKPKPPTKPKPKAAS